MFTVLLLALVASAAAGQRAVTFDASTAVLSPPKVVAEIDAGKIKGQPVRLAWSDDGSVFVRWVETDVYQNELARNFVVAPGGAVTPVTEEPSWSSLYWAWKAGIAAPGAPDLRLDIESRQQGKTATGAAGADIGSAGGVANPNRSDPTGPQIVRDFGSMQTVATTTVRFHGELVAEVQNARFVPGLTFSWAPAPGAALAYVNGRKRLVVIDRAGRKIEVAGTGDVLLPAWSPDGARIAWLQKIEKKKFAIMTVEVGR